MVLKLAEKSNHKLNIFHKRDLAKHEKSSLFIYVYMLKNSDECNQDLNLVKCVGGILRTK